MQMDSDSDLKFHHDSVSDDDLVLHHDSLSDDDMDFHDNLVSDDDDGTFDGDFVDFDNDDDDGDDNANFYDNSVSDEGQKKQSYRILNASGIRRIQEKDIASVCSLLSVTAPSACVLLYHYEWNLESLMDQWFADEERVRKEVGLVQKGLNTSIGGTFARFTCEICFDEFCAGDQIMNRFCDHKYCKTCLVTYISTAIDDGPGCLSLRCPDPSCNAAIGLDVVNLLVYGEYMKKYNEFFVRSYVEGHSNVKWCPAPDCNAAIQYNGDGESGSYEVVCDCSCKFCWRCIEDGHRPVDCDTVARWIKKNKCEESNVEWILAYTKPCPKCKRPIQKNDGCMHMTCNSMCKHQFCWTCLHPWSDPHNCNAYEAELNGETIKEAKRRKDARALVERYSHYYERWDANQRSRMKAQSDLEMMQRKNTHILCEKFAVTKLQFTCVIEAWQQIIECRRALKWSYAYGYFIPENERAKAALFEYLQGEAEAGLERLHQCAEKELAMVLKDVNAYATVDEFENFRVKLVGLTKVTRNYFANLVTALENNLGESENRGAPEEKSRKIVKNEKKQFMKQKEKRSKGERHKKEIVFIRT